MAQSYTRQSTFADGDTITAALFNNEYDQLVNAFSYSSTNATITGHRHDGSAGEGGNIGKIGDLDFLNKIEVDDVNNRWGVYVEVTGVSTEQIRIQDGSIVPVTTNDIDLGTGSLQFKNLYIDGTASIDNLTLSSGVTVDVILDEDTLVSNSATALATQQSIKAYVDSQVTAQDLDFQADTGGALNIDLDSETMILAGGTGINTSGALNTVTIAIDSTVATLTDVQTLTNKTIDASLNTLSNIANASLTNSTVSYGGIQLSLGGSDATPAFNLVDATGYLGDSALVTTGALNSGSITSGFGSIDVGSSSITTLGTVSGGTLTGTLSTAAQANVTSLGTLTSLAIAGDLTVDTSTLKVDSANNRVGILNAAPDVTLDIGSATDAVHVPVGTTAQRPGTPAAGYFRYNADLEQFEGYTDTWGAIGGGGTNTFTYDSYTGDNVTVDFVLSQATNLEGNLIVFIDGVFQTQDAYTIATAAGVTTLTFSAAPATGRKIVVYTVAAGVSGNNMNLDSFSGDGATTDFTLSINAINENNTQIFIDGVYQQKDGYTVTNTTLSFSAAPPLNSTIEVMTFTQTEVNVPVANTIEPIHIKAGDFYFDTNTLYIDSVNNRVGVGTASPSAPLDIVSNATGGTTIELDNTSTGGRNFTLYSSGSGNSFGAGNFALYDADAAAVRMLVDSSGNVGIGATNPAGWRLRIEKADAQHLLLLNTTGNGTRINMSDQTWQGEIEQSAGSLLFKTGGTTERMRIDSAGTLSVANGNQTANAVSSRIQFGNRGTFSDTSVGRAEIAGVSEGSLWYSGTGLAFSTNPGPDVTSTAPIERMRIDSSGNVGIGVSPAKTLDVRTSGGSDAVIRVGSSSSIGINVNIGTIEFYSADADDAGVKASIANYVTGNQGPGGTVDGNLIFSTTDSDGGGNDSPTERMRIDSSGLVNIGRGAGTHTNSKLLVQGSSIGTTAEEWPASDAVILSTEMTDSAYHSILQLVSIRQSLTTGNAANGYLGFSTIDDSNAEGIQDAGRIAIVNETGSSRNSATALSFWTNAGGTKTTAATEKMRIDSSGHAIIPAGVTLGTAVGTYNAANTLDDYEEGTWTPSVFTSSGTIGAVSGQTGTYTKIGKQVTLWWNFNITDIGTGSGTVGITNASKPFSHDSSISYYTGINRPRSGTSSICELDTSGIIYMYGSTTGVSFYTGTITYNVA